MRYHDDEENANGHGRSECEDIDNHDGMMFTSTVEHVRFWKQAATAHT